MSNHHKPGNFNKRTPGNSLAPSDPRMSTRESAIGTLEGGIIDTAQKLKNSIIKLPLGVREQDISLMISDSFLSQDNIISWTIARDTFTENACSPQVVQLSVKDYAKSIEIEPITLLQRIIEDKGLLAEYDKLLQAGNDIFLYLGNSVFMEAWVEYVRERVIDINELSSEDNMKQLGNDLDIGKAFGITYRGNFYEPDGSVCLGLDGSIWRLVGGEWEKSDTQGIVITEKSVPRFDDSVPAVNTPNSITDTLLTTDEKQEFLRKLKDGVLLSDQDFLNKIISNLKINPGTDLDSMNSDNHCFIVNNYYLFDYHGARMLFQYLKGVFPNIKLKILSADDIYQKELQNPTNAGYVDLHDRPYYGNDGNMYAWTGLGLPLSCVVINRGTIDNTRIKPIPPYLTEEQYRKILDTKFYELFKNSHTKIFCLLYIQGE